MSEYGSFFEAQADKYRRRWRLCMVVIIAELTLHLLLHRWYGICP